MFTIDQIKQAHAKVKSGADFPAYVQELKKLGVERYAHDVTDGVIHYYGSGDYALDGQPKWEARPIARTASPEILKAQLLAHQRGESGYPDFCLQAAEAGVEKWVVDLQHMTCSYYDLNGNTLLVEAIPVP